MPGNGNNTANNNPQVNEMTGGLLSVWEDFESKLTAYYLKALTAMLKEKDPDKLNEIYEWDLNAIEEYAKENFNAARANVFKRYADEDLTRYYREYIKHTCAVNGWTAPQVDGMGLDALKAMGRNNLRIEPQAVYEWGSVNDLTQYYRAYIRDQYAINRGVAPESLQTASLESMEAFAANNLKMDRSAVYKWGVLSAVKTRQQVKTASQQAVNSAPRQPDRAAGQPANTASQQPVYTAPRQPDSTVARHVDTASQQPDRTAARPANAAPQQPERTAARPANAAPQQPVKPVDISQFEIGKLAERFVHTKKTADWLDHDTKLQEYLIRGMENYYSRNNAVPGPEVYAGSLPYLKQRVLSESGADADMVYNWGEETDLKRHYVEFIKTYSSKVPENFENTNLANLKEISQSLFNANEKDVSYWGASADLSRYYVEFITKVSRQHQLQTPVGLKNASLDDLEKYVADTYQADRNGIFKWGVLNEYNPQTAEGFLGRFPKPDPSAVRAFEDLTGAGKGPKDFLMKQGPFDNDDTVEYEPAQAAKPADPFAGFENLDSPFGNPSSAVPEDPFKGLENDGPFGNQEKQEYYNPFDTPYQGPEPEPYREPEKKNDYDPFAQEPEAAASEAEPEKEEKAVREQEKEISETKPQAVLDYRKLNPVRTDKEPDPLMEILDPIGPQYSSETVKPRQSESFVLTQLGPQGGEEETVPLHEKFRFTENNDKKLFDELFGPVFGLLDNNPLLQKLADDSDLYVRQPIGTRGLSILKQANELTEFMYRYQHEIMDKGTFDNARKKIPEDMIDMQESVTRMLGRSPERYLSREEVDKLREIGAALPRIQKNFAEKLVQWQERDERYPSPEKLAAQDEWANKFREEFTGRLDRSKPGYTVEDFAKEVAGQLEKEEQLMSAGKYSPAQKKTMAVLKEGVEGVLDCLQGKTNWNYQAMDAYGKLDYICKKNLEWISADLRDSISAIQNAGESLNIVSYSSDDFLKPVRKHYAYASSKEKEDLMHLPKEEVLAKVQDAFRKYAESSALHYVEPDFREALDRCVAGLEMQAYQNDSRDNREMRNLAVILREELDRDGFTPLARSVMSSICARVDHSEYHGDRWPENSTVATLLAFRNTWVEVPVEAPDAAYESVRDQRKNLFSSLDAAYTRAYNETRQKQIDNPELKDELLAFNVDLKTAFSENGIQGAEESLKIQRAKQFVSMVEKGYETGARGFAEILEKQLENSERLFRAEKRSKVQERVHRDLMEGAQGILKLFKENAPWDEEAIKAYTRFDSATGVLYMDTDNKDWYDENIVKTGNALHFMMNDAFEKDILHTRLAYNPLSESPLKERVENERRSKNLSDTNDITLPHEDILRLLPDNYAWHADENLQMYVNPDLKEALSEFIDKANSRVLKLEADDPELVTLSQLRCNASVLKDVLEGKTGPEEGLTALVNIYGLSRNAIPGLFDPEIARQLEKNPPKAELADRLKELDEDFRQLDKENGAAYLREAKLVEEPMVPEDVTPVIVPKTEDIKLTEPEPEEGVKPVIIPKTDEAAKPVEEPAVEDLQPEETEEKLNYRIENIEPRKRSNSIGGFAPKINLEKDQQIGKPVKAEERAGLPLDPVLETEVRHEPEAADLRPAAEQKAEKIKPAEEQKPAEGNKLPEENKPIDPKAYITEIKLLRKDLRSTLSVFSSDSDAFKNTLKYMDDLAGYSNESYTENEIRRALGRLSQKVTAYREHAEAEPRPGNVRRETRLAIMDKIAELAGNFKKEVQDPRAEYIGRFTGNMVNMVHTGLKNASIPEAAIRKELVEKPNFQKTVSSLSTYQLEKIAGSPELLRKAMQTISNGQKDLGKAQNVQAKRSDGPVRH